VSTQTVEPRLLRPAPGETFRRAQAGGATGNLLSKAPPADGPAERASSSAVRQHAMEFTPTGDMYVLMTVCGAFVAAFLLSLLPLARKTRMRLVFAGPVGAVAGILFGAPGGLDGVFWTIVAGYGVLAWSGGLAVGYLVHRGFTRVRAARCGRGCLDWSPCAD
jgi:hypothetical protein